MEKTKSTNSVVDDELIILFSEVRDRTIQLCEPLRTEDFVVQSAYFSSPVKWHIAHTTWFFEQMVLKEYFEGYQIFDPEFHFLFNSYYNSLGERTLRAERGNITRPTVDQVKLYRKHVDTHIHKLLQSQLPSRAEGLIRLGLNHEQQHQELLITDLKNTLGHNPTFPIYHENFNLVCDLNEETGYINIPEGIYEVGYDGNGFCFDNELKRHKTYIQEFEISKSLITNKEFIEFMNDGGYQKFNFWLDEGWAWINENNINSPLYWHKIDGDWFYYTLSGLKPLDLEAILCHVSFYEAAAFANWKGLRLPTEFEWEAASSHFKWGKRWEWTNSAYLPYPGFSIDDGAVGEYNGKFMINQMVLRGASRATAKGHSRNSYRNFFHPNFQWQFSGIRLAR